MRIPEYLSPTSIKLFEQDTEKFYWRYLCPVKQPRDPQTQPMCVGSAFDAYCKSWLYDKLIGDGNPEFERDTLFEAQVEPHNYDFAKMAGEHVFGAYKQEGCLRALMSELKKSVGPPRFEFSMVQEVSGVPLRGIPDIFFINEEGARVIYDWKVNGYCSTRTKSPMKGYVRLMPGDKVHKNAHVINFKGIPINAAMKLEDGDRAWADQETIYSWILGEPVGSEEVIFGIEQICGPPAKLRFASHRLRCSPEYQYGLLETIEDIWERINTGRIFDYLDDAGNDERIMQLDEIALTDRGHIAGLEGEEREAEFFANCE
jgi:hypothetical protein